MTGINNVVKSLMTDHGYSEHNSGGHCMVWCKNVGATDYVFISSDEGGLDGDPSAATWGVGRYCNDHIGFVESKEPVALYEALKLAEKLPAPKIDEQETLTVQQILDAGEDFAGATLKMPR